MNILHLSAIKLVFLRLRKSKAIVYNVQKIACNWCHNHLLFDMVQHVEWPYIFMIQVTHCLIWSDIWNSHMIFVWYMRHSLFDMVQHVNYYMIFVWYEWHSLIDMVQHVNYRMIFVWYEWHSLFDMVQHVNYHNLWFLCDTDDTHYLIWFSMWTIVIYDFCVILMTLIVWYGTACSLSQSMIFVWYRWHSLFDMVQHVNYRNLWFLCDIDDTHCLIWYSM